MAILSVFLSISLGLVFLNMLIALMGDTYDRVCGMFCCYLIGLDFVCSNLSMQVQDQAAEQGLRERAIAILEMEELMSDEELENPRYFPTWIHVLRPLDDDIRARGGEGSDPTNEWRGRLKAIEGKMAGKVKEGAKKAARDSAEQHRKLSCQAKLVLGELNAVQVHIEALTKSVIEGQRKREVMENSLGEILTLMKGAN